MADVEIIVEGAAVAVDGEPIAAPEPEAVEAAAEGAAEVAEVVTDSAVEIARIEADRDVTIAAIHADVDVARTEADVARVEEFSEIEQCRTRIATLEALTAEQAQLILQLSPPQPPNPPAESEAPTSQEIQPEEAPPAPEPPPRKRPAFRLI